MTWVRIDDRFAEHEKLLRLPRGERWTWVELLCYCGRADSPIVPSNIGELLRHATPAFVKRCESARLLDRDEQGVLTVHDWAKYNPKDRTNAERQRRYRNALRNGESNGESNERVRNESDAPAQARARVPTRPPLGGRVGSEGASASAAANGPLDAAAAFLKTVDFDHYPDPGVLRDELTDRKWSGERLTVDQADALLSTEQENRSW